MATPQIWRFGVFEVEAQKIELRRNGIPLKIREQSFRILVYLLEHAGELVSREDLRRVLWPSDTYVDFDHSLNTAMMKLRDVLGDVADAPVYIETVPKRGYRFIAPVAVTAGPLKLDQPTAPLPSAPDNDVSAAPPPPTQPLPAAPSKSWKRATFSLVLLAVAVLVGFLLFRHHAASSQSGGVAEHRLVRTIPITSAAGDAISPVFSPDGREIAYVWDGTDRKGYDVYVQLIGSELPLRLTYNTHGLVGPPAWSPDGRQVAFQRCDGMKDGVFSVPALGGEERQLTSVACFSSIPSPLAWLADGTSILMVDRCSPNGRFGLVNLSLATGEKKCLNNPGAGSSEDIGGAFAVSPDGATVAFLRTTMSLCCDIYTMPITGGQATRVAAGGDKGCNVLSELGCSGLMWTPDGRALVFVDDQSKLTTLLRISASGGPVERETTYPAIGSSTRDGTRFVYSQHISTDPPAIWRAEFSGPGGSLKEKSKVVSSQFPELDAQPSPDGTFLVWMSMRTGSEEIFMSDSTGHKQIQLTHFDRYSGTPRWSPDSQWIAFDSYKPGGHAEIFVVDRSGRNLHSVISEPFDCVVPSWSHDGKVIYYSGTYRNGDIQVWKHYMDTGANVQLTHQGGFNAFESVDGNTVYYTRYFQAGIWSTPSSGGAETMVVAGRPQIGFWGHYAVTSTGLYFLDNDADPHPTIDFYDFATRKISPIFTLDERPASLQPSLSATADGKTIYFTQYDRQSVIKMMEFSR